MWLLNRNTQGGIATRTGTGRVKRLAVFGSAAAVLVLPTVAIATAATAHAWEYPPPKAEAVCADNKADVTGTFTNGESAKSMVVSMTAAGKTTGAQTVAPGKSANFVVHTGNESVAAGTASFNLSWSSGSGSDTAKVSYTAKDCKPPVKSVVTVETQQDCTGFTDITVKNKGPKTTATATFTRADGTTSTRNYDLPADGSNGSTLQGVTHIKVTDADGKVVFDQQFVKDDSCTPKVSKPSGTIGKVSCVSYDGNVAVSASNAADATKAATVQTVVDGKNYGDVQTIEPGKSVSGVVSGLSDGPHLIQLVNVDTGKDIVPNNKPVTVACDEKPVPPTPPTDVCKDVPGNQPVGTVCHPQPPAQQLWCINYGNGHQLTPDQAKANGWVVTKGEAGYLCTKPAPKVTPTTQHLGPIVDTGVPAADDSANMVPAAIAGGIMFLAVGLVLYRRRRVTQSVSND